ncbi:unnamed protein product [Protopolystoma xenopodis]|uniref:Uncharacterized protein n=1 Tax=Protopolystoma xenopodis TaxID=117903 RepID=A0A3S4ZNP5_9PLAT|nr:unnamed protein product [Protopolystoma xenopodis]
MSTEGGKRAAFLGLLIRESWPSKDVASDDDVSSGMPPVRRDEHTQGCRTMLRAEVLCGTKQSEAKRSGSNRIGLDQRDLVGDAVFPTDQRTVPGAGDGQASGCDRAPGARSTEEEEEAGKPRHGLG